MLQITATRGFAEPPHLLVDGPTSSAESPTAPPQDDNQAVISRGHERVRGQRARLALLDLPAGRIHAITSKIALSFFGDENGAYRHERVRGQGARLALLVLERHALLVLLQHRLRVTVVCCDEEAAAYLLHRFQQLLQLQKIIIG